MSQVVVIPSWVLTDIPKLAQLLKGAPVSGAGLYLDKVPVYCEGELQGHLVFDDVFGDHYDFHMIARD